MTSSFTFFLLPCDQYTLNSAPPHLRFTPAGAWLQLKTGPSWLPREWAQHCPVPKTSFSDRLLKGGISVRNTELAELGIYPCILHKRQIQKTRQQQWSYMSRVPLHRDTLAALGCSVCPLTLGNATYAKDIAKTTAKKTIHIRVTDQTTLCGRLLTWIRVFMTLF